MEEEDKEINTEEDFEDEIESLEDLEGKEGDEGIEKKIDRRLRILKIPENYPEIYLNDSQVTLKPKTEYCSATIRMKPSQRELITFVQQYLGFENRVQFIRYVLLKFSRNEMKLIEAKRKIDIEFTKDFQKLRRQELIEQNNIKKRMEKLKKMAPSQDGGGLPFTAEDLMD